MPGVVEVTSGVVVDIEIAFQLGLEVLVAAQLAVGVVVEVVA